METSGHKKFRLTPALSKSRLVNMISNQMLCIWMYAVNRGQIYFVKQSAQPTKKREDYMLYKVKHQFETSAKSKTEQDET